MKTLHFSKTVNASADKVWNTMLEDETYRQWTRAFTEGSHFEGSWEEGEKILFLDSDGGGMVATIAESRPHEFISIKHIGVIRDGVEDTDSEEARKWAPAFENYTFTEEDGKTTVTVDMDIEEEHEEMFNEVWPKALQKLKELAENQNTN